MGKSEHLLVDDFERVFFFSFWSNKGIMVMPEKNIQVYKYCIWASKFALYRGMG